MDEDKLVSHSLPLGCTWSGKLRECIEVELGPHGHDGYKYLCPRCKRVIYTDRHVFYD